jgi:hypothetical protein
MALVQMSDFLENELLDHVFNNAAYTAPSSVWIALFTSATGLETNNQANEVSGTGYARLEVGGASGRSFIVAAARGTENNEDWQFANPGAGGWGTVVAMAVCDASTTGQILMYCDLTVNRTINQDDDVIFSAGEIKFFFNEDPDQISDFLAHELLDHVLRNASYTAPATLYCGLWTADNGLAQNTQTSEVNTSHGYARQTITFANAASGLVDNDAQLEFGPNTTTNWGTVTHVAILDASTNGQVLMTVAVDSSASVVVNDLVRFAVGTLDLLFN